MDSKTLTTEEKAALSNLVRSPGWYVLLQHHVIPQLHAASQTLDRLSGTSQSQADVCRGIKLTCRQLIEELYKIAELPNPFEQHALGLMANLASYTTPPENENGEEEQPAMMAPLKERSGRAAYPV